MILVTCAPISFKVSHLVSSGHLITTLNITLQTSECGLVGTGKIGFFVLTEQTVV